MNRQYRDHFFNNAKIENLQIDWDAERARALKICSETLELLGDPRAAGIRNADFQRQVRAGFRPKQLRDDLSSRIAKFIDR